jgi:hypothetical protein
LAFSGSNKDLSHDLIVLKFIDFLKSREKIADWQVRQANNAITLYMHQFKNVSDVSSTENSRSSPKIFMRWTETESFVKFPLEAT